MKLVLIDNLSHTKDYNINQLCHIWSNLLSDNWNFFENLLFQTFPTFSFTRFDCVDTSNNIMQTHREPHPVFWYWTPMRLDRLWTTSTRARLLGQTACQDGSWHNVHVIWQQYSPTCLTPPWSRALFKRASSQPQLSRYQNRQQSVQ